MPTLSRMGEAGAGLGLFFNKRRAKSHVIDPLAFISPSQLGHQGSQELFCIDWEQIYLFPGKPSQFSYNISVSKISQLCPPGAQPLPGGRCGLERGNYTFSSSS